MTKELAVFDEAVQEQMPVLVKATGLNQQELKSKLISFAYETQEALKRVKANLSLIDKRSIAEAFKASLDTGIPVDKRQLAYVINYGNSIQYRIGFKGFISRIKEIYPTATVKAELVYAGDVFTVEKIDGQARYTHKVSNPFATVKDMVGAYAYIQYTDNGKDYSFIETMGKEEINKIKGKAATKVVWDEWYGEMAKKAVIRRLCKTLFIGNPKIQALEDIDNKDFNLQQEPVHIDYDKPEPMPEEVQPNKADVIAQQDAVVEQEIKEESGFDTMYMLEKVEKKSGVTKSGKPYVLNILHLEGGVQVSTFDDKPYEAGQTVELIEWDKEKNRVKRVNIL